MSQPPTLQLEVAMSGLSYFAAVLAVASLSFSACGPVDPEDGDTSPTPGDTGPTPSPSPTAVPSPTPVVHSADIDDDGSINALDCDDADPSVYPDATEVCNGKDDDCDQAIDDDLVPWYPDADQDGHGARMQSAACAQLEGYVTLGDDCNDADPNVYPGALELCDAIDQNCDRSLEYKSPLTFHQDEDGDGFGGTTLFEGTCAPAGTTCRRGDCDDADAAVHPGAEDPAADERDQDCGGTRAGDPHVGLNDRSMGSVQQALDAAEDGQTVWVGPGVWESRQLRWNGRDIRLAATDQAIGTWLDADEQSEVVVFDGGEGPAAVLDAFTVTGGDAIYGGGIFIAGSSPTLVDCVITGNEAYEGGGIFASESTVLLSRCTITGNMVDYMGGGIFLFMSALVMERSTVTYNEAEDSHHHTVAGGGLAALQSDLSFQEVDIIGNGAFCIYVPSGGSTHYYGTGGGLYLEDSTLLFDGGTVSDNGTLLQGGGLYMKGGEITLSRVDVLRNSVNYGRGGGLYAFGSSGDNTLRQCRIRDNGSIDVTTFGGGVSLEESTLSMQRCEVAGNGAQQGSGVHLESGELRIEHTILVGNRLPAGAAGAGALEAIDTAVLDVTDSVVAYNDGYNFRADAGVTAQIRSSAVYNPAESPDTDGVSLDASVLRMEPGFLRYDAGIPVDYHLSAASPLRDAGASGGVDADGSPTDIGIYGGEGGDLWDWDLDGAPDWFWPGSWQDAPQGFDPEDYDCDDLDPSTSAP